MSKFKSWMQERVFWHDLKEFTAYLFILGAWLIYALLGLLEALKSKK